MRRLLVLASLFATLVSGCVCGPAPDVYADGTLTIANDSSFVLVDIRVTSVFSSSWGPNLLRDGLFPGEEITVGVACDTWDVLIVDELFRECVLRELRLCSSDQFWVIDDSMLYSCGF